MDPRLELTLVGLSHRTAPVELRERYVVGPDVLPGRLGALLATEGVEEAFVFSTCNRTEVLVAALKGLDPRPDVCSVVFPGLPENVRYVYRDVQAAIHLFRVAAGLDSLVVGESEVLGQLRRSYEVGRERGALGPLLDPLLRQALRVGKRVRAETELGRGTLSVARVGVEVAGHVFGSFERCSALVVGAGETGVLVARHLVERGLSRLAFANRTPERAAAVAAAFGAQACGLDELGQRLAHADLVLVALDGAAGAIRAADFDARVLRHRDRPLLCVDLSVPRAIEPRVAELDNVLLYDLDALGRVVGSNRRNREHAVEGTSEILVGELHKYLSLRTFAAFTPAIAELRDRFARVREDVLDRVAGARSDPGQVELAHELERRLLDVALHQMKEGARRTRSEEVLDREYQRFLDNL